MAVFTLPKAVEQGYTGNVAYIQYPATVPVREILEWYTDVVTSYNGKEERYKLRILPRHELEYIIPLNNEIRAEIQSLLLAYMNDKWAVPLWSAAQELDSITDNSSSIHCVTDGYPFLPESLVMLYDASSGQNDLLKVTAVNLNVLTIDTSFRYSGYTPGTTLVPVRLGTNKTIIQTPLTAFDSQVRLSYDIDYYAYSDYSDLPLTKLVDEFFADTQYRGRDAYHFTGYYLQGKSELERRLDSMPSRVDSKVGPFTKLFRKPIQWHTPFAFVFDTASAEQRDLFGFASYIFWLQRVSGKYRSFWLPSYENDVQLLPSTPEVVTNRIRGKWFSASSFRSARNDLAIEYRSSTGIVWHFTSAVVTHNSSEPEVLNWQLTDPLPSVRRGDILTVSYLYHCRLDQDRVVLEWSGGGIVRSNILIKEIPFK